MNWDLFIQSGALLGTTPGRALVGWGEWRSSASPSHEIPSFYQPDFFLTDALPWRIPSQWALVDLRELREIARFEGRPENRGFEPFRWTEPSIDGFAREFEALQSEFGSGKLTKAVPVVFARSPLPEEEPGSWLGAVLSRLIEGSAGARSRIFGSWDLFEGIVGATPEDLFTLSDGRLRTMALAGTYPPGSGDAILRDPKERREHQIVIDDIASRLEGFGAVQVGETEALELPSLTHLRTPIEVGLRGAPRFEELVAALHPTPALGAFPREAGRDYLLTHGAGRGRFGAPFGALLPTGEAFCAVAIRNLQWKAGVASIGTGCGVISESVLSREWEELRLKRDAVRRSLGV